MGYTEIMACPVCGGELEEIGGGRCRCLYCGGAFTGANADREKEVLRGLLDDEKAEKALVAKRNLYDAMHAVHLSSEECLGYAHVLKSILPDDYLACFAVVSNSRGDADVSAFLNGTSGEDMETYAPAVLDFMCRSLTPGTCAAVGAFIERAFSRTSPEYGKYTALYNDAAEKVSNGVFDVNLRRDAFIAYSSSDIVKAVELCDYLEGQGISCFLSSRNLPHGAGAVENYQRNLETAMDNCGTFVFVSSRKSRSGGCDAFSKELVYVRNRETAAYGNGDYAGIPQRLLKHRVEYLIEDYGGNSLYEDEVKSFFHGLSWATSVEEVGKRILDRKSHGYVTKTPFGAGTVSTAGAGTAAGGRDSGRGPGFAKGGPALDCRRYYRYLASDEMPATLRRGCAHFTNSLKLYLAGCRAFGWDERKKNGFGMYRPMYSGDVTPEGYAVWSPCNSDLTMSAGELGEKGIQNFIGEDSIEERVYDPDSQRLGQDIPDETRVTFVRIRQPGKSGFIYMFYGVIRCESIRYEHEDGRKLMIRTFRLISDTYPDD